MSFADVRRETRWRRPITNARSRRGAGLAEAKEGNMSKRKNKERNRHKSGVRRNCGPEFVSRRDHVSDPWSIRRFREGTLTGPVSVEFKFPTEGGGRSKLRIAYSELRHPGRLLDRFADYLPVFPPNVGAEDHRRTKFLNELVLANVGPVEWVPHRTGFYNLSTFVTHGEILRADGTRVPRRQEIEAAVINDLSGTAEGERDGVLDLPGIRATLHSASGSRWLRHCHLT